MAESTSTLKATDLLSVKSRVSWGAIGAGAMIALAVYFFLTLLGLAIGLEVASRRAVDQNLGVGAAVYSVFTLLLSMFLGGWTTSRLAVGETKLEAILYGVILWGVLFLGMFWLIGAGVRVGFGALVSGAVVMNSDDPTAAGHARRPQRAGLAVQLGGRGGEVRRRPDQDRRRRGAGPEDPGVR